METPLLAAARARGVHAANGLGMLVHQAALAFELWTGVDAPLAVDARRRRRGAARVTATARRRLLGRSASSVGWLLDPVITRVPAQAAGARAARPPTSRRRRRRPRGRRRDRVAARCSARPRPASTTRGRCPRTSCSPAALVALVGDRPRALTCCPNRIVYPLDGRDARAARARRRSPTATSTPIGRGLLAGRDRVRGRSSCCTSSRRAAWASAT